MYLYWKSKGKVKQASNGVKKKKNRGTKRGIRFDFAVQVYLETEQTLVENAVYAGCYTELGS